VGSIRRADPILGGQPVMTNIILILLAFASGYGLGVYACIYTEKEVKKNDRE
jgi:hypothetical protein